MTSFKDRLLTPYNGLKVRWFDDWHPSLNEALNFLPELDACPHELFRLLAQNPGQARKKIALVSEDGKPVAVVGIRQTGRYSWEPMMQWIVPGEPFPSAPGYSMRTMESLNVEMRVAWWRMDGPPQPSPLVRYLEATPTYGISSSDDIEEYWRQSSHFKTIRRIRNRCKDLKLVVNATDSAEWIIKNWEAKWREQGAMSDPSLDDRILAAKYMIDLGRYFTFILKDGDVPAGGATMLAHQKDLVAGVLYREPEYHKLGVGDRLIDICFSYGVENEYETIDIGGGHEYKKHWAPQKGQRWWFHICPEPLYRLRETVQWGKKVLGRGAGSETRHHRVE